MKVGIIGGTGVLSSAVTNWCLALGYEVIHFNRGSHADPRVHTVIGDRNNSVELAKLLEYEPDVIIDMVCFEPQQAKKAVGVFANRLTQYIYCSTSCVYTPRRDNEPLTEASETKPTSDYGITKLAAEEVFQEASKKGGFKLTIFRPGHVYNEDFTINQLSMNGWAVLSRLKRNLDVVLTEEGNLCYQANHADNIGRAFAHACLREACFGKIYNIAGEETMTWNEIYNIGKDLLGSKSRIVYRETESLLGMKEYDFGFLETVTRFPWVHSIELLRRDIPEYRDTVSFARGIEGVIRGKYDVLEQFVEEDAMYETLIHGSYKEKR